MRGSATFQTGSSAALLPNLFEVFFCGNGSHLFFVFLRELILRFLILFQCTTVKSLEVFLYGSNRSVFHCLHLCVSLSSFLGSSSISF